MHAEHIPAALRRRVQQRAKGRCEYCLYPDDFTTASFHCDHIVPRKKTGKTELDNLAWACPWCNTHKHTKTYAQDPQTGQRVALFNPRLKKWERHFMWSESLLTIIGRTQTGRATVEALNMNRAEHINFETTLKNCGRTPP